MPCTCDFRDPPAALLGSALSLWYTLMDLCPLSLVLSSVELFCLLVVVDCFVAFSPPGASHGHADETTDTCRTEEITGKKYAASPGRRETGFACDRILERQVLSSF